MPHTSQMLVSKWISRADVEPPVVMTIRGCTLESVSKTDTGDQRWVVWFNEHKKGLRLNKTLIKLLEAGYGEHSEQWVGRRVKLYWDPTVQFGGELVGGVRMHLSRATSQGAAAAALAVPAGARFDPMTGKPLATPAAPQPRFDPMTGKPLTGAETPAAVPAGEFVDTSTGEVVPGADADFDDDIPF